MKSTTDPMAYATTTILAHSDGMIYFFKENSHIRDELTKYYILLSNIQTLRQNGLFKIKTLSL